MLVGTDNGRVNEQMFHVGITAQSGCHTFPNTFLPPTGEADKRAVPMAYFFGQITLRATSMHDPENGFDETPVILGSSVWVAFLAW